MTVRASQRNNGGDNLLRSPRNAARSAARRLAAVSIIVSFASIPAHALDASIIDGVNDVSDIVAAYDKNYFTEKFINKFEDQTNKNFASDRLDAWRFAQTNESYATMFEVTRDPKYLAPLAKSVKLAIAYRDDRKSRKDEITNTVRRGWGRENRQFGRRIVEIGTQSLVLSPISRLYNFVAQEPALASQLSVDPAELKEIVLSTLKEFDEYKRTVDGAEYYVKAPALADLACGAERPEAVAAEDDPDTTSRATFLVNCDTGKKRAGQPEPYNIQFKVGIVLAYLTAVDADPSRTKNIQDIFNYFVKTGIDEKRSTESNLIFKYGEKQRSEDVSHLNLDVDFFMFMWHDYRKRQPNFPEMLDERFLKRTAGSLINLAAVPDNEGGARYKLSALIDGSRRKSFDSRSARSCMQIALLVAIDDRMRQVCGNRFIDKGANPLGLASLAKGIQIADKRHSEP